MTGRPVENRAQGQLVGRVEFSVAGRAITHLQIPLTTQRSNPIQVSVIRSGVAQQTASNGGQQPPIVVMLSQASGSISDGMVTSYGEGYATGPIETSPDIGPGSYWVHTNIPQKTLCEASFTAGAASLAREPLVIALSGATAPLTLTLREDCASLKISLPQNARRAGSRRRTELHGLRGAGFRFHHRHHTGCACAPRPEECSRSMA